MQRLEDSNAFGDPRQWLCGKFMKILIEFVDCVFQESEESAIKAPESTMNPGLLSRHGLRLRFLCWNLSVYHGSHGNPMLKTFNSGIRRDASRRDGCKSTEMDK